MAKRWIINPPSSRLCDAVGRWKLPPLLAQLLINRGLRPDESATPFLAPQLKDLHPPQELPGAADAARIIVDAVRAGEKIVLYGDYDVDGTTGLAILWHVLTCAGAKVSYYVPHRIQEGFGLNIEAARRIVEEGDSGKPVGRRLDFLLQEFGREANTIGSKGCDAPIAYEIVELKTEIERLREQVQNVE